MTDKQDNRLLTPEEIEAIVKIGVMRHYADFPEREPIIHRDIAKAQLAKIDKLKLDRPELREGIDDILGMLKVAVKTETTVYGSVYTDQILALFDEEEIRRQERERIWAWGLLMCDDYDHTNITLPSEMGGGKVKKNNRRRARCAECWRTLLGKP